MSSYAEYVNRLAAKHGEKFSDVELSAKFRPFFHGQRIRVQTTYGTGPDAEVYTRTGTVSGTGGWRPSLMLMHRSSDHGSSDLLRDSDVITHVQARDGRTYVPVANLYRDPNRV
jgi:hypothetical protein